MRDIAKIVLIVGVANFAAFVIGTFVVGGDAVNGGMTCGHHVGKYYLYDKRLPNACHEVSRGVYLYSKIHCWSLFLSWPFVMVAGLYAWYGKEPEQADDPRASGSATLRVALPECEGRDRLSAAPREQPREVSREDRLPTRSTAS